MTVPTAWPLDQPPCDSAAEAAVLWMLLVFPERMDTVSLNDRLFMPEHKHLWQAMGRVHMRKPDVRIAQWWLDLQHELHRMLCPESTVAEHQDDGCWTWRCYGWRTWMVLNHAEERATHKDLDDWLARLDRCVDARRLIAAAQEQAERAWHGDVDAARRAAGRAAHSGSAPIRVDIE